MKRTTATSSILRRKGYAFKIVTMINGGEKIRDLCRRMNVHESNARVIITKLVELGIILKIKNGKGPYVLKLTKEGEEIRDCLLKMEKMLKK